MSELEWNLTASTAVALEFVQWLETEGVRWENFVDETGHDSERAWESAEHAGWVERVPITARLGDTVATVGTAPKVTAAGRIQLEKIAALRANRAARAAACRQGLLLWIYNTAPAGTDKFMSESTYQFYGTLFTQGEVREAVAYLRERSLLTGTGATAGVLVRPGLTAAGVDIVEKYDGDLRAVEEGTRRSGGDTYYQQSFHGTVTGQVAQGHSVQQVQHQGVDPEAIADIFAALRDVLKDVADPGLRDDAEAHVADLEQAVSDGDAGAMKKFAGRLMRFAGLLGSQAATTVVTTETTNLLQLMGVS